MHPTTQQPLSYDELWVKELYDAIARDDTEALRTELLARSGNSTALFQKHPSITLEKLSFSGTSNNPTSPPQAASLMEYVAYKASPKCMEILLAYGVDPNKTHLQYTPAIGTPSEPSTPILSRLLREALLRRQAGDPVIDVILDYGGSAVTAKGKDILSVIKSANPEHSNTLEAFHRNARATLQKWQNHIQSTHTLPAMFEEREGFDLCPSKELCHICAAGLIPELISTCFTPNQWLGREKEAQYALESIFNAMPGSFYQDNYAETFVGLDKALTMDTQWMRLFGNKLGPSPLI